MGSQGEKIAESHLISKGFRIHFRNWRSGRREVDIIASKDNQWVFVEVKTRSATAFGFPEDFVDERKKAFLRDAADAFLWEEQQFPTLRYDIISILMRSDQVVEIRHFEDAFY